MKNSIRTLLLLALALSFSSIGITNAGQNSKGANQGAAADQETPPYHKSAKDAQPLPRTLPPSQFSNPLIAEAYEIAGEIPDVLAQQPCYCHCDRELGHTSLLDCFTSTHTAGCGICMGETFFAYRMAKQGKTPAEIREGITRGDWKNAGPVEK
jgi:hypothetical protein